MNSKPIRFAFGHKSRVGKDTAVDHIVKKYNAHIVRMATPVYHISYAIQKLYNRLYMVSRENMIRDFIEAICAFTHFDVEDERLVKWVNETLMPLIESKGTVGKIFDKVPWLLQAIGTDLRNVVDSLVWIRIADKKIEKKLSKDPNANICIPDMRFPNEFAHFTANGFTTVRVNRANRPIDRDPNHESEVGLDNHPYNYVINNDVDMDYLFEEVEKIITDVCGRESIVS